MGRSLENSISRNLVYNRLLSLNSCIDSHITCQTKANSYFDPHTLEEDYKDLSLLLKDPDFLKNPTPKEISSIQREISYFNKLITQEVISGAELRFDPRFTKGYLPGKNNKGLVSKLTRAAFGIVGYSSLIAASPEEADAQIIGLDGGQHCTSLFGDANGDNDINIFDVILTEKIAVGLPGPAGGNADADCNGVVNILDVIWEEKMAVGLPGSNNCNIQYDQQIPYIQFPDLVPVGTNISVNYTASTNSNKEVKLSVDLIINNNPIETKPIYISGCEDLFTGNFNVSGDNLRLPENSITIRISGSEDANPNNNQITGYIKLTELLRKTTDLQVLNLQVPDGVKAGDKFSINATVGNVGNDENATLILYRDMTEIGRENFVSINSTNQTFTFGDLSFGAGNYKISANVINKTMEDVNPNNNRQNKSFNVAPLCTPSAEICDGLDNDCDGEIDEGVKTAFYRDLDNDTWGNLTDLINACSAPIGYVSNNLDCRDYDPAVNPNAVEICNGIDDNCNGEVDEGLTRSTNELGACSVNTETCVAGYYVSNREYSPVPETCNNLDDDCNGYIDENVANVCDGDVPKECKSGIFTPISLESFLFGKSGQAIPVEVLNNTDPLGNSSIIPSCNGSVDNPYLTYIPQGWNKTLADIDAQADANFNNDALWTDGHGLSYAYLREMFLGNYSNLVVPGNATETARRISEFIRANSDAKKNCVTISEMEDLLLDKVYKDNFTNWYSIPIDARVKQNGISVPHSTVLLKEMGSNESYILEGTEVMSPNWRVSLLDIYDPDAYPGVRDTSLKYTKYANLYGEEEANRFVKDTNAAVLPEYWLHQGNTYVIHNWEIDNQTALEITGKIKNLNSKFYKELVEDHNLIKDLKDFGIVNMTTESGIRSIKLKV